MNPLLHSTAPTSLRRLLGGWRDILEDLSALCRDLRDLPEMCQCGHGPEHLQGSCPCCGTLATARIPDCQDCGKQIVKLRARLDQIVADTHRFFPVIKDVMTWDDPDEGARARDIERHIGALARLFDQLALAEGQFRSECRASHLHTLKAAADALRREADGLNRLVSPQPENSYVKD